MTQADPKKDAAGQFVRTQHGATNSGLTSAEPRIAGSDGDATFSDNAGSDEGSMENHRHKGARKFPFRPDVDIKEEGPDERTRQLPPKDGLTEAVSDTQDKTRQSDGVAITTARKP